MKKITVLTITFNRGEHNVNSINSILSQTFQDFKYIVVNDGSTDNSREILGSITHPSLTVIHRENKGFTNTLADMMERIDTPYVAIHGAGDISHPQRLKKQIELIENDESLGAVGCYVRQIGASGQLLGLDHNDILYLKDPLKLLLKRNYFRHGEVLMRYSAYLKAGGYRRFFEYAQDYDLWLRMAGYVNFAKVDEYLYDQRILSESTILSDYEKTEKQQLLAEFAKFLTKNRSVGNPDLLDVEGEKSFSDFKGSISGDFIKKLSLIILEQGKHDFRQTKDPHRLHRAVSRSLEIDSQNRAAHLWYRLCAILISMDKFVLKPLVYLISTLLTATINYKRKIY